MIRMGAMVFAGTLAAATPALAQSGQGQSTVGNVLQGITNSINGNGASNANPNDAYQQSMNQSAQQYRGQNNQQLEQEHQKLQVATAKLQGASQALDQEMAHRGLAQNTGNYGAQPNRGYDRNGGGYGSSTPQYNQPNGNGGYGYQGNQNDNNAYNGR